MYRFFVPQENVMGEKIAINGDDVNHIKNVLRMESGEKIVVSCGQGLDYYCIIDVIRENEIELLIEETKAAVTELPVSITLFQALPKQDKMDLVVQKAVELGASEIIPVRTKRCVVKLDEKRAEKKTLRWQAIAESAAKQSGRGIVPQVRDVMNYDKALEYAQKLDMALIPYELFDDMKSSVEKIEMAAGKNSIGIFIGPEGGFERGEMEQAMERQICPVSLGRRILRTETAGLAILSMLMFLIEGRKEES